MRLLGSRSGFKNGRDLLLFVIGTGVLIYHLATTTPDHLSIPLLIFCGGLMGAPYALGKDEKKGKDKDSK